MYLKGTAPGLYLSECASATVKQCISAQPQIDITAQGQATVGVV